MRNILGHVQGTYGTPVSMVQHLPGASSAIIESIHGEVHNVEGMHDRPRAGEALRR